MTVFYRQRLRALVGAFAAMWAAGAAWAEPAPTFNELLRKGAESPRRLELETDVGRAQGLARQARARPNPTISVVGENFGGSSPYGGFDRAETTVQYSQPIEVGGKRGARVAAADAEIGAARARSREGRIAYAGDLARLYGAAEVAERRARIVEEEVSEAEADMKLAQALVAAGKEARLREVQAATELTAAQSQLESARAERVAAFGRLAVLAGEEVPFTSLSDSLLDRPADLQAGKPVDPLGDAGYLAAKAERDAAAKQLVAERKRAISDVTGQVGVRRFQEDRSTALVAGISVPLNLFDRNRGNIAAAEAALRGAEARLAAARLGARANLDAAKSAVSAAEARSQAAGRTLATAQEAYRLARIAYEAGKSPLIELIAARRGVSAARRGVLDAAAARLEARTSLARIQGLTVTGEPVE